MKVENIDSWLNAPIRAMQFYNPSFRDKTNDQILNDLNPVKNWLPYGYNHFIICQSIATVFILKN